MEAYITYRTRLHTADIAAGSPEDMPVAGFASVLDLAASTPPRQLILRGNEAALHPEFSSLLDRAERKGVALLLETSGLMPDDRLEEICRRGIPLLWRVYDRTVYTAAEWDEMGARLRAVRATARHPLRLLAITLTPEQIPAAAVDLLQELEIPDITFRAVCPSPLETFHPYADWLSRTIPVLAAAGHRVAMDCGLPVCLFSDTQLGSLARLGILPAGCHPRPGVLPDMRVYHCHQMLHLPGGTVAMFKRTDQLAHYFYRRHHELQWDLRALPNCATCPSLAARACTAECMAVKVAHLEREYAELREATTRDDIGKDKLITLGRVCYELSRFAEATTCLQEARRRDPANAQVHLLLARTCWESGNPTEAEEEYRKAARLTPDGHTVLVELLTRLQERGNPLKVRRLTEEIRTLQTTQPTPG